MGGWSEGARKAFKVGRKTAGYGPMANYDMDAHVCGDVRAPPTAREHGTAHEQLP